jgi:uncharacterized protein with ATP-grasp and redox domains
VAEGLLQKYFGAPKDRYRAEKEVSNRFVLERMDAIRDIARTADDPVYAGLQLALLGNYLDFEALGEDVSFDRLEEILRSSREIHVDREAFSSLQRDLERGKRLLYVTDNAGEIGFDRIFAEEIYRKYPHLSITFCVRGGPTLNDATREDAAIVGIPFPVIDNGTLVPGTRLDILGPEAKAAFADADVIISKGQGNVETLWGCGLNVYFAFLAKCQRFQEVFQVPHLTPMLLRERQ